METVPFIAMLIALLVVPAAVVTAIGGGMVRLLAPTFTRRAWFIAVVGSTVPALMLLYGLRAGINQAEPEKAGDTLSLGWWLLTATPAAWIACLLMAWWAAPKRSST